jgi:tRNA threonylcarbamoyladenosine biosynthesis protein TsaE
MSTASVERRICPRPEDTEALGAEWAPLLKAGDVLLLRGVLGAGKTCLTRGLARGLGANPEAVASPTFSLVREVTGGRLPLHHVDLYRLEQLRELDSLGLDELFNGPGVSVVEWPERLGPQAPAGAWMVELKILEDGGRDVRWSRP